MHDYANYFLGTTNSSWETASNWSLGIVPSARHRVVINANCNVNSQVTVRSIQINDNVSITTLSNLAINAGKFVNYGTCNVSNSATLNINTSDPHVYGNINFGNTGRMMFSTDTPITIPVLDYYTVVYNGIGSKTHGGNITFRGDFTNNKSPFFLGNYNFTVNGTSYIDGQINKSTNTGSTIFKGLCITSGQNRLNVTGNPIFEFQNGFSLSEEPGSTSQMTWFFTTRNQTFRVLGGSGNPSHVSANILIDSNLTVTFGESQTPISIGYYLNTSGIINGVNSASTLNVDGRLYLSSTVLPMQTGVFNHMNGVNSAIGYSYAGNQNLPYTTYNHLVIANTGIKSLIQNTTVNGNLTQDWGSNGTLDLGSYNFQVNGATTFSNINGALTKNTATGTTLFVGKLTSIGSNSINFTNNPEIELRGGLELTNVHQQTVNCTFNFTTNNQTITNFASGARGTNIKITGDITVTNALNSNLWFTGTLNGTTANSKLINLGIIYYYQDTLPMSTGILDLTTGTNNTFVYAKAGTQPIHNFTYRNLNIVGSGTKEVSSNLVVNGNFFLGMVANTDVFQLGNYDFQVGGTSLFTLGTFSKSGSGAITFVGAVSGKNSNLSGNPTIEFRGGFSFDGGGVQFHNWGTGTMRFTTNNQTLNCTASVRTFSNPISIENITVTYTGNSGDVFEGLIDGTTSNSKLDLRGTIEFANATKPMANQGQLITNLGANTVVYSNSSSQIIHDFTHWHVVINGSGTKTLTNNFLATGGLTLQTSTVVTGDYNFEIQGNTDIISGVIQKNSFTGYLRFGGLVTLNTSSNNCFRTNANPTIEFKGGFFGRSTHNLKSWNVLLNGNQNLTGNAGVLNIEVTNVTINGASTVNLVSSGGLLNFHAYGIINADNAGAVLNNQADLYLYSSTMPMSTGTFNYASGANSLCSFVMNGDFTIPYNTFAHLGLGGTGTKKLSGNTVCTNLTSYSAVTLDLDTYDFTANGVSDLRTNGNGGIKKHSSLGTVTFVGQVTAGVSWSIVGSPSFVFRNGLRGTGILNLDQSNVTFSTNHQTILGNNGGLIITTTGNVLIDGAINVTGEASNGDLEVNFNGSFNGNNVLSKYINKIKLFIGGELEPMSIGSIDCSTNTTNTVTYNRSGVQNVKGGTYRNLTLSGSGTKTLQGNVSVTGTFSDTGNLKDNNGYTFGNP